MPTKPFAKPMMRVSTLLCATLILASCAPTMGSGGTDAVHPTVGADTFCRIAKPIGWSTQDTDATIREVKAHNEVWKRLCSEGAD